MGQFTGHVEYVQDLSNDVTAASLTAGVGCLCVQLSMTRLSISRLHWSTPPGVNFVHCAAVSPFIITSVFSYTLC